MAEKVLKTLCVFFLLPIILICGCESPQEQKSLVTDFTADFTAQYRGVDVKGSVTTNRQGVTSISITYPETINGLNINYRDSQMEISRESLVCSADEAYLPQRSFPSQLKSVLKGVAEGRATLTSQNENGYTYNLRTDLGNCKITADKEGEMLEAEIKDSEFYIKFSEIKTALS